MTLGDLYTAGLNILKNNNIEDFSFDCDCLFEAATGFNRSDRIVHFADTVDFVAENTFLSYIERRIAFEPLQYILGSWEFMGLTFSVGQGVLIPRPETEMLVEKANEIIKKDNIKVVYDLCAGSGAIGLSVAHFNPQCEVFLFEKYEGALKFLEKNRDDLKLQNAHIISSDVLKGVEKGIPLPGLILSNPPYICSDEIKLLQKEVLFEPPTALDGSDDGLLFYRTIAENYYRLLKKDCSLIFECGDGQSSDIMSIYAHISSRINVFNDFNNIDRMVRIIV